MVQGGAQLKELDGTGEYHVKQSKSEREGQISDDMINLSYEITNKGKGYSK